MNNQALAKFALDLTREDAKKAEDYGDWVYHVLDYLQDEEIITPEQWEQKMTDFDEYARDYGCQPTNIKPILAA